GIIVEFMLIWNSVKLWKITCSFRGKHHSQAFKTQFVIDHRYDDGVTVRRCDLIGGRAVLNISHDDPTVAVKHVISSAFASGALYSPDAKNAAENFFLQRTGDLSSLSQEGIGQQGMEAISDLSCPLKRDAARFNRSAAEPTDRSRIQTITPIVPM